MVACGIAIFIACVAGAQPPDTLWTRTYLKNRYERAIGFDSTADGGYVMCGSLSDRPHEYNMAFVRKVDGTGNQQWIRSLGSSTSVTIATDVLQASDRTIITVGGYESGAVTASFFLKHGLNGDLLVERTMGGMATCVAETADGGYLVAGQQIPEIGRIDAQVYKLAHDGTPIWCRRYSRGMSYRLDVADVVVLSDGRFILVTYSKRLFTTNPTTLYVVCASESGDTLWTRELAGGDATLQAISACVTNDNQVIISCDSDDYTNLTRYVLFVWMNDRGDTLQTRRYGAEGGSALSVSISRTFDGGLACSGSQFGYPQATLWRLDSLGNMLWQTRYDRINMEFGGVRAIQNHDGGYTMLVETYDNIDRIAPSGIVCYEADGTYTPPPASATTVVTLLPCYPNPFNGTTTIRYELREPAFISVRICNIMGREVSRIREGYEEAGNHAATFDAFGLGSGVYIYSIRTESFHDEKTMLLLK